MDPAKFPGSYWIPYYCCYGRPEFSYFGGRGELLHRLLYHSWTGARHQLWHQCVHHYRWGGECALCDHTPNPNWWIILHRFFYYISGGGGKRRGKGMENMDINESLRPSSLKHHSLKPLNFITYKSSEPRLAICYFPNSEQLFESIICLYLNIDAFLHVCLHLFFWGMHYNNFHLMEYHIVCIYCITV